MSPHSPNWYWHQLGYAVERERGPCGLVKRRTIRRPDGSTVTIELLAGEQRYDAELRTSRAEHYCNARA